MRFRLSFFALVACLLALSTPVWASALSAKIYLGHSARVGATDLKPGNYRVSANESTGQVKWMRNDRLVAKVKGKWVKLGKKSQYTEMLSDNHIVQEVRFAGKKRAIKFSS